MDCFIAEVRANYHIYCRLTLSSKATSKFPMEVYQLATDLFLPTLHVFVAHLFQKGTGGASKNGIIAISLTGRRNH